MSGSARDCQSSAHGTGVRVVQTPRAGECAKTAQAGARRLTWSRPAASLNSKLSRRCSRRCSRLLRSASAMRWGEGGCEGGGPRQVVEERTRANKRCGSRGHALAVSSSGHCRDLNPGAPVQRLTSGPCLTMYSSSSRLLYTTRQFSPVSRMRSSSTPCGGAVSARASACVRAYAFTCAGALSARGTVGYRLQLMARQVVVAARCALPAGGWWQLPPAPSHHDLLEAVRGEGGVGDVCAAAGVVRGG